MHVRLRAPGGLVLLVDIQLWVPDLRGLGLLSGFFLDKLYAYTVGPPAGSSAHRHNRLPPPCWGGGEGCPKGPDYPLRGKRGTLGSSAAHPAPSGQTEDSLRNRLPPQDLRRNFPRSDCPLRVREIAYAGSSHYPLRVGEDVLG